MEHKDEQWVKYNIQQCAHQHGYHGKTGCTISPDDIVHHHTTGHKGEADQHDTAVFDGIGQIGFCRAEEV